MLNVPLDTKHAIMGMLFADNLLTNNEKKMKNQEKQNTKPRLT